MASQFKSEDSTEAGKTIKAPDDDVDTSKAEGNLKAKFSRKRTKTGCLTCRKRRIKCGEEQPVCNNCVKSKRQCEGYGHQRAFFRQPTLDYQQAPHGGAHITFQAGHLPAATVPFSQASQSVFDARAYSELRPRPDEDALQGYRVHSLSHEFSQQPPAVEYAHRLASLQGTSVQQTNVTALLQPEQQHHPAQPTYHQYSTFAEPAPEQYMTTSVQINPSQQKQAHLQAVHPDPGYGLNSLPQLSTTQGYGQAAFPDPASAHASQALAAPASGPEHDINRTSVGVDPSYAWPTPTYTPRPELLHSLNYPVIANAEASRTRGIYDSYNQSLGTTAEFYQHQLQLPTHQTPTQLLTDAAVELQDDDYYDVQPEEELEMQGNGVSSHAQAQQVTLQKVLLSDMLNMQNMQIRRYDSFLYDGMLDHYRAEWTANPLKNPATARVFAHFVSTTGPGLSVFERRPASSSMLFTGGSVPPSQQSLWTYTMPMAALHHQGLLHALLALSSLHIARLQGASATPSYQHYAWALKRVHGSVGSKDPKKRLQLPTIGASMLLGFYEILTADHSKWNTHLSGSKQLLVETDFAGMTRQLCKLKRERSAMEQRHGPMHTLPLHLRDQQAEILDQVKDFDERVVSRFVGREVRFDNPGYVESPHAGLPPALDVSKYETLRDLYWWYLKQDAFQSMVSGNGLLLEYSRWPQCPPRAPLARPDAVYGSFDHLVLLLGRVAEFAAKDRNRKLRQMEANGGQWRPAQGMRAPQPPKPPPATAPMGAHAGPNPPAPNTSPAFYGMAPPPRQNVQMPSSYRPAGSSGSSQPTHISASSDPQYDYQGSETHDLGQATEAALTEYSQIRAALADFAHALSSEAFQPLGPEFQPPLDTAFGPAIFYRSYDIGCLWAVYNMAVIVAIRSHPHMHPAAHAAAAITAQETAFCANEVGRIGAGIVPGPANEPLNPTLGAALCESCLPSFFAAIQYQRADQRHETVMRIYGISLRTGWGTMELIANGCETAWVKAGEAGRGPPYQRCVRPQHSDDIRLNGQWERVESGDVPEHMEENDRRLVPTNANARLQWAIGIMGMESDYGRT